MGPIFISTFTFFFFIILFSCSLCFTRGLELAGSREQNSFSVSHQIFGHLPFSLLLLFFLFNFSDGLHSHALSLSLLHDVAEFVRF